MVGQITTGISQQLPNINTAQVGIAGDQGKDGGVRENEKEQTKPAGTSMAESQKTETRNNGRQKDSAVKNSENIMEQQVFAKQERGSMLDISV